MISDKGIISVIVILNSLMFVCYYFFACYSNSMDISNLKVYMTLTFIYISSFIVIKHLGFNKLVEKVINRFYEDNKMVIESVILIVGCLFIHLLYIFEVNYYPYYPLNYFRHNIPELVFFFLVSIAVCFSYKNISINNTHNDSFRTLLCLLAITIHVLFLYTPNPLNNNWMETYHLDAYVTHIINAIDRTPHELYSASIYGHYSIIFFPLVLILQLFVDNYYVSVSISICFIGLVTYILQYRIINKLIKNDIILFYTVFANLIVSTELIISQYYQILPHRLFFPTIIIYIVCFKGNKRSRILEYLVVTLSVIWNLETGAICLLSYMFFDIYCLSKERHGFDCLDVIIACSRSIISFFVAFIIVNIYNILNDGNIISLKTFIYPIGSAYSIAALELPLAKPFDWYFLIICVFVSTLSLYYDKIIKMDLTDEQLVLVINCLVGLGVICYAINRFVNSNFSIVYFNFILVLGYICDKCRERGYFDDTKRKFLDLRKQFAFFTFSLIVIMAVSSVLSCGLTLKIKMRTSYEKQSLNIFLADIDRKLPLDCIGFGESVPELFALLNRKTGIYIADWPDIGNIKENIIINNEAIESLKGCLSDTDKDILVNIDQSMFVPYGYYLKDTYEYKNFKFQHYTKK